MYEPHYLTDKYSILSLFLWVAVTLGFFFVLTEVIRSPDFVKETILYVSLFCIAFLAISNLHYLLQKKIPLPTYLANLIGENECKAIRLIKNGKADFSERSSLFWKIIGAPNNHAQYEKINKQLYLSRLIHELGHSKYRDFLFAQLYLIFVILSFSIILMLFIAIPEPQELITIFVLFFLTLFVAIIRLIVLLRVREYRADSYALKILGEEYITFLKHQKNKSLYFQQNNKFYEAVKWLTHPSFDNRLKHALGQITSSKPFLEGFYWSLVFFFTGAMFIGLIIFSSHATRTITFNGQLNSSQQFIANMVIMLSVIGINSYVYGISKIQYSYFLEKEGFRKALSFTLSSVLSFWGCIFFLDTVDIDSRLSVEYIGNFIYEIYPRMLMIMFWFLGLLILNLAIIKIFSHKNHLPYIRCIWAWVSIIVLIYLFAPHVPTYFNWPSWDYTIAICFIALILAIFAELITWKIKAKTLEN